MANVIEVIPLASASTNPLGITFSATAEIEFIELPEKLVNKTIANLELKSVDATGLILTKSTLQAFIPWSIIKSVVF